MKILKKIKNYIYKQNTIQMFSEITHIQILLLMMKE